MASSLGMTIPHEIDDAMRDLHDQGHAQQTRYHLFRPKEQTTEIERALLTRDGEQEMAFAPSDANPRGTVDQRRQLIARQRIGGVWPSDRHHNAVKGVTAILDEVIIIPLPKIHHRKAETAAAMLPMNDIVDHAQTMARKETGANHPIKTKIRRFADRMPETPDALAERGQGFLADMVAIEDQGMLQAGDANGDDRKDERKHPSRINRSRKQIHHRGDENDG